MRSVFSLLACKAVERLTRLTREVRAEPWRAPPLPRPVLGVTWGSRWRRVQGTQAPPPGEGAKYLQRQSKG